VARYPQGQPIRLSTTVRDVTGALIDAGTLALTVQKPDASQQTYTTPTHDGTGLYHQDIPTADIPTVGHYAYKWVATGTGAGVSYSNFDVFDPLEVAVLSLQDAKDHLNIAQATTAYDAEIASKVATIQANLEKLTGGPILTRAVTERVPAPYGAITLMVRQRPLVAVTSITDVASGTAISTSDLELDQNAGVIRRKLGLAFLGLGGAYTVAYTAGWGTAVPPSFNEAARIILEHLWQTQHGPSLRPSLGGEETVTLPGFGFAIPNRAAELLAPYVVEAFV
jgi:hypothetical protein